MLSFKKTPTRILLFPLLKQKILRYYLVAQVEEYYCILVRTFTVWILDPLDDTTHEIPYVSVCRS